VLRAAFTSAEALSGEDRARWHLLASHRPESAPLVDAAWMLSWADAFAPPEPVLLGAWEDGQLVGLAALQRVRESCGGRRLAVLQSLTNVESYRFDFLAWEGRADIADLLWRALFEARRWDLIHLEHIPEGSSTLSAGLAVARERGWRAVVEPTFLTPWRPLSRAEPWDQGLKRKFKSNLRNRERRLAALGEVSFEVVTGQGALRKALDVFYDLEAGGWKGQGGTAVARRQQVKRLYDRLLERAGEDMRIPILAVSGRAVAAQVLRVRGKIMFMLKTAYDEAYSAYAPGQLLTARVLQYGREDGLEALDFLADNADWKADWAPRFLQHDRLLLFAPSLPGRYAYWVRYGLREQAKRVPGLVGLVRWLRRRRSEAA
jgi:CelD/BcsL family acetyltransferase involved in cellulose biosynthesis